MGTITTSVINLEIFFPTYCYHCSCCITTVGLLITSRSNKDKVTPILSDTVTFKSLSLLKLKSKSSYYMFFIRKPFYFYLFIFCFGIGAHYDLLVNLWLGDWGLNRRAFIRKLLFTLWCSFALKLMNKYRSRNNPLTFTNKICNNVLIELNVILIFIYSFFLRTYRLLYKYDSYFTVSWPSLWFFIYQMKTVAVQTTVLSWILWDFLCMEVSGISSKRLCGKELSDMLSRVCVHGFYGATFKKRTGIIYYFKF